MNPIKEICEHFGQEMVDSIPNKLPFQKAVLFFERQPGMTGYHALLYDQEGRENNLNVDLNTQAIEDLYQITSKFNDGNNEWNKAKFTLFPDKKINLEFEFDKEWQDEIDRLNRG